MASLIDELPATVSENFTQDEIQVYVDQFNAIDTDRSGFLEFGEMKVLMKNLGMPTTDDSSVQALIDKVDENNDGKISMNEFFGMMNSAAGDISDLINKNIDKALHDHSAKKMQVKTRKKSLAARMFKKEDDPMDDEELAKGDRTIELNTHVTDPTALARASIFERQDGDAVAEDMGIKELYTVDNSGPFEKRVASVYLQDGSVFNVVTTAKSRVRHALVQMKHNLRLKHDADMGLYIMCNATLVRHLDDEDFMFSVLEEINPNINMNMKGVWHLIYKRRTYVNWSPLYSEAEEAIDVNAGAHRVTFVEAQKRFLSSDYPSTTGQAIELGALLASAATENPSEMFVFDNLKSFLPYAIRNSAKGLDTVEGTTPASMMEKQKRHLAYRVFMQGKRKDFYNGFAAIEVERNFIHKCQEYFAEMYGDTFFEAEVVERDPGGDVTTSYIVKQPKVKIHVGVGHNGIHKVFPDGRVHDIEFTNIVRWLVPTGENIFAVWTQHEVTFLFTELCEEIQLVLNQYIREFLCARDTPGKMAYPVRQISADDIREVFDQFDADSSGCLDRVEISEFVATFGIKLSAVEEKNMYDMIDKNNDGQIQFNEFLPWWKEREETEIQSSDPDAPANSDDNFMSILDSEVRKRKKDGEPLEATAARLLKSNFITFKGIMLGSSNVGKTNLIARMAGKDFSDTHHPTLETEYTVVALKIGSSDEARWIKVECWDTAGQEKYNAVMKSYYRGANEGAAILVYDVNNSKSLEDINRTWLPNLLKNTDDVNLILLANKCDNMNENITTGETFANLQAKQKIQLGCVRSSAKMDKGVREAFATVFQNVYEAEVKRRKADKGRSTDNLRQGVSLSVGSTGKVEKEKGGCC